MGGLFCQDIFLVSVLLLAGGLVAALARLGFVLGFVLYILSFVLVLKGRTGRWFSLRF